MLIKELLNGLISLIFPPICKSCDKRIDSGRSVICNACWNALKNVDKDLLSKKEIPENIDEIYAVYLFDDLFQKIVHALKYQGTESIGIEIGKRMSNFINPSLLSEDKSVLIPIPLHPIKHRERGYNQSELIAIGLSESTNIPINTKVIKRVKNTKTQTKLSAEERKQNMENAFTICKNFNLKTNKVVILVDDVFTTGATMNSAAMVLRNAGFRKVIGLAAAVPDSLYEF
jgi:ComF family protein